MQMLRNKNSPKRAPLLRTCYTCKGTMKGSRENYRYTECGLNSVVLVDVVVYHCKCGAIVPEIPAVEPLHQAITFNLLRKKTLLSGEEIRFLRKCAGYSATRLAAIMAVTKESLSRWENDKQVIGAESDRLLRFACLFGIAQFLRPVEQEQVDRALEFVKASISLNLPAFFEQIEQSASGSMPQRLNPEQIAEYGHAGIVPMASDGPLVVQ